jgi:hypothetical protein
MPANSNGYSQWFGKLAQINTSGGAQTWLDEQIIYAVPGASATITNVAPTSGEYAAAAVVVNAGSGTSGVLFVRPTLEVASSTSATANTLVLRDGSGGASFAGMTVSGSVTNSANNFFTAQQDFSDSATWLYTASSKANHLSSLGAGTTGSALLGAATAAAARTTLELGAFSTNGSITGTEALTFTSAAASDINILPGTTGSAIITSSPTGGEGTLLINNAAGGVPLIATSYGGAAFALNRRANGTVGSPTTLLANDLIGGVLVRGYNGTAFTTASNGGVYVYAAQNWTTGATGTRIGFETTANGGTTRTSKLGISDTGIITATAGIPSTTTTTGTLVVTGGVGLSGALNVGATVKTGGYTFATLPTPTIGMRTYITDGAAIPIYMANAAGGGSTVTPVFYNGTNWINA